MSDGIIKRVFPYLLALTAVAIEMNGIPANDMWDNPPDELKGDAGYEAVQHFLKWKERTAERMSNYVENVWRKDEQDESGEGNGEQQDESVEGNGNEDEDMDEVK